MPSEAEALDRYEAALGRPVRDLLWYEVLAGFRFGIVFMRAAQLMAAPGDGATPVMERVNPVTGMLARMLALPAPS
jgi:aminoglycoside phosphotransferase (APT) family kinase protein